MKAGDVLLVQGEDWEDFFIRWGQRLRFRGSRKRFAKYTHCALIINDVGAIVEAVASGTRISSTGQFHPSTVRIVRKEDASDFKRDLAVSFAKKRVGAEYGYLTIAGIGLYLLTGGRLDLTDKDSLICSQLVGEALIREGVIWGVAIDRLTPADIAEYFSAP